jgi:hypothetical protein
MTGRPILRTVAVAASAALLLSALAGPVSAAKPKCAGKTATIVGTKKGEVIRGTRKADVIVARGGRDIVYGRGGNDTICGGGGADKLVGGGGNDRLLGHAGPDGLFGGAGRDTLFGNLGNDRFNGGTGSDACYQGPGSGKRVACERPVPVPVPVPTPGPTLLPLTGILAVAYSDIDGLDGYSTGDVLIAQLLDTDKSETVSPGDTIKMGRYPTTLTPKTTADFLEWGETHHHIVDSVIRDESRQVGVTSTIGGDHSWYKTEGSNFDEYYEYYLKDPSESTVGDRTGSNLDFIKLYPGSPSKPSSVMNLESPGTGDDHLIDVEIAK